MVFFLYNTSALTQMPKLYIWANKVHTKFSTEWHALWPHFSLYEEVCQICVKGKQKSCNRLANLTNLFLFSSLLSFKPFSLLTNDKDKVTFTRHTYTSSVDNMPIDTDETASFLGDCDIKSGVQCHPSITMTR